jgi:hypothetical protein
MVASGGPDPDHVGTAGQGPSQPRLILLGARSPRIAPRPTETFTVPPGVLVRAERRVALMRRAAERRRRARDGDVAPDDSE